ncbi:MAG: DUF1624 domain-containing protein [Deltaproteobacteria bacterium]|nr:DUF1624 domain-containing protein [Deltaproteobacteria bacterium]
MMKRVDSIDVIRAIAIILMVPCHFILLLSPYEGPFEAVYTWGNEILGGLSAPLFLFVVGLSQALSSFKNPPSETLFDKSGMRMVKRGIFIFVIGLLIEIPLEGAIYAWDILPLIGVSLIILCVLRRSTPLTLFLCALCAFLIAPWLRGKVGYLSFWSPQMSPSDFVEGLPSLFTDPLNEYLHGLDPLLSNVAAGFFVTGYFPFFPWIMFPILGFMVGKCSFGTQGTGRASIAYLALGCCLVSIGLGVGVYVYHFGSANFESGFIAPLTFFPITPPWLTVQLGACLILFFICRNFLDGTNRTGIGLDYCRVISRYSFSVYLLHYLLAYWSVRIAGLVAGEDGFQFLANAVSAPTAWVLAVVALVSFYFLFQQCDKRDGKFTVEWFMKQLIPAV